MALSVHELKNSLGELVSKKVFVVDSTNVCSWIKAGSETMSQPLYISRRVKMIKERFGYECYWTSTNLNPADCGTKNYPGAKQISPTSQFFIGPN